MGAAVDADRLVCVCCGVDDSTVTTVHAGPEPVAVCRVCGLLLLRSLFDAFGPPWFASPHGHDN
jgi:hypothetical protein